MEPNIHQVQGINHLNKVLSYAPFVTQDGSATVYLTQEDWQVVVDTLFADDTPVEHLPAAIKSYRLAGDRQTFRLETDGVSIDVARI